MTGIYNATDGPLAIDRAGRMLGAREPMPIGDLDVEASPLAGHIAAERIALVDTPQADDATPAPEAPDSTSTRTRKGRASTSSQEA